MNKSGPVVGRPRLPTSPSAAGQLPGEEIIVQTPDRVITVTNHRVQYAWKSGGSSRYVSITLDAISSCGLTTNSQPILLVLGIVAAVIGLATIKEGQVGMMLLIGAFVLIIAFVATRSAALLICSNGGERVTLPASSTQHESLLALLNVIDAVKVAAMGRSTASGVTDLQPSMRPPPTPTDAR